MASNWLVTFSMRYIGLYIQMEVLDPTLCLITMLGCVSSILRLIEKYGGSKAAVSII